MTTADIFLHIVILLELNHEEIETFIRNKKIKSIIKYSAKEMSGPDSFTAKYSVALKKKELILIFFRYSKEIKEKRILESTFSMTQT